VLYAYDQNKKKIEATPSSTGYCPGCGEQLIPRCGNIRVWHWAHKSSHDCDTWHKPETEWHIGWKKLFGRENCEVVIHPHRADILGNMNVVIELQHSKISAEEIEERETFYKKMIWVVDASPFLENLFFYPNFFHKSSVRGELSRRKSESDWVFYNYHPYLIENIGRKLQRCSCGCDPVAAVPEPAADV
jgi:competence CoiA-like predicted nuclease